MAKAKKISLAQDTTAAIEGLINELEQARQMAQEASSPTSMISATLGKAKLLGLLLEKNREEAQEEELKPVLVRFVATEANDNTQNG